MRHPHPEPRAAGFTLVELMISLAIAAFVVTGIFTLYNTFFQSTAIQDQVLQLQQNSRVGLDDLARDLRLAGVDVTRKDGVLPDQAVFAYAAPYDVVFNANLDDNLAGLRPDKAPDKVPSALAGGLSPFYDPSVAYPYAETVRWSLDADSDGTLGAADRMTTDNPALYRLKRQVYGYSAGTDSNGPETATGAEDVRGPETYPDGTRPPVLFQYWVREIDLDSDKAVDAGEDINGNGVIDTFLWGDDGSGGGTAGDGVLEDGEVSALLTGNGGGPKIIDNFNALITAATGDARATALTRAQVLSNVQRVVVTLVTETPKADPNYSTSPHGSGYAYREHVVTASVAPRNQLTDVTADMSLTVSPSPDSVTCPNTSTVLTVALYSDSGALYTIATDVDLTTSLGSFSASGPMASKTVTLSGGTASVVLYGDSLTTSTTAVVDASTTVGSEGYTASASIDFLPGPVQSIKVEPDLPGLPADGLSTTGVTASLLDACGKPAGDGDAVAWSVATNPLGIGGTVLPAAGTASGNKISTTLTSGLSAGVATITATDGVTLASGGGTVNFTNCVVTLTPTDSSLPADGMSSTSFAIHVADVGGTAQPGVTLALSTSDGTVAPGSVVTNGSGDATGTLTSSTNPHTAQIMAIVPSAGGYCANAVGTADVVFSDCGVTIASDVAEVVPGNPGGQANITATVSDSGGGGPLSGQGVTFDLTAADGSVSPATGTTNGSGQATTTFTAGPTTGVATVKAASGCGTATVDVYVRDCVVVALASPSSVPPAKGNTTTVTATLSDSVSGTPLAGRTVTFALDNPSLLDFTSSTTATTDVNGEATVTLATKGVTGTATVTATSACGTADAKVNINDWQISLSSAKPSIDEGTSTTLTATLTAGGVPADPTAPENVVTISFDAPGGLGSTVSPASGGTVGGTATFSFTAGSTAGTVVVRASATIGGATISATTPITITSVGGLNSLVLDVGSPATCGGSGDKASFRLRNAGIDNLVVTDVQFEWVNGTDLQRVKTGGLASNCSGGSDLWRNTGCGKPDGSQSSPAQLTSFCKGVVITSGATYTFNEVNFSGDMRGEPITVILTHQPAGGGPSSTSTINFNVPNF